MSIATQILAPIKPDATPRNALYQLTDHAAQHPMKWVGADIAGLRVNVYRIGQFGMTYTLCGQIVSAAVIRDAFFA